MQAFSSCSEWGYSLGLVHGLLTVVTSLVAEHGLCMGMVDSLPVSHQGSPTLRFDIIVPLFANEETDIKKLSNLIRVIYLLGLPRWLRW